MRKQGVSAGKRWEGFTLIELLIVVAIIAILAAIAVPNFLEAQVRAKTSRAHADMRTYATAIEAYAIDFAVYPPSMPDSWGKVWDYHQPMDLMYEPFRDIMRAAYAKDYKLIGDMTFSQLTTPVAYMSSILQNPFSKNNDVTGTAFAGVRSYWYERVTHQQGYPKRFRAYAEYGFAWILASPGPLLAIKTGALSQTIQGIWIAENNPDNFRGPYDPSNGTVSKGSIYRSNQGLYSTNPDPERYAIYGGG